MVKVGGALLVCSLLAVASAPSARAEEAKPKASAKAKAPGQLSSTAALLVSVVAERTLPKSLSAEQKTSLDAIAAQLRAGNLAAAKAGWGKFLKAHGKNLEPGVLRGLVRWVVRDGLLEPQVELTSTADKARFNAAAAARGAAGLSALRSALAKAKGGQSVKVKLVVIAPYAKFAQPVSESEVSLDAVQLKNSANELQKAVLEAQQNADDAEEKVEAAKDHMKATIEAIKKYLDIVHSMTPQI